MSRSLDHSLGLFFFYLFFSFLTNEFFFSLALARFFEINLGPIRVLVTVWILFLRNIFFFIARGVRASLRVSQLIPEPTEHPASLVGR